LIASIHSALDDGEMKQFQEDVLTKIGEFRSTGIIVDVAALDVLDSFGSSTLRNLAHTAKMRGALMVIVGIRPEIAASMVQLGMQLDVHTALDLEAGLETLEALTNGVRHGRSSLGVLSAAVDEGSVGES
jgi:rsbT antagonist protein RsbS